MLLSLGHVGLTVWLLLWQLRPSEGMRLTISSSLSSLACLMRCVRPPFLAAACAVALAGWPYSRQHILFVRLTQAAHWFRPAFFCFSHSVFACTVKPAYYNCVYLFAHSCLRRTSKWSKWAIPYGHMCVCIIWMNVNEATCIYCRRMALRNQQSILPCTFLLFRRCTNLYKLSSIVIGSGFHGIAL